MYFESNNEEEEEKIFKYLEELEDAVDLHTENILNNEIDKVGIFIRVATDKILEMADEIEDNEVAIKLTHLLGAVMGAMGNSIMKLRAERDELRDEVLEELRGDQVPERN